MAAADARGMNELLLQKALKSLEIGDRNDALISLLEAWRQQRSPALADVIDSLSADATRALPALDLRRKAMRHRWLDLASERHPADVERLLTSLVDMPNVRFADCIERLAFYPADPRIAIDLANYVTGCQFPWIIKVSAWRRMLEIIAETNDARCREVLERTPAGATTSAWTLGWSGFDLRVAAHEVLQRLSPLAEETLPPLFHQVAAQVDALAAETAPTVEQVRRPIHPMQTVENDLLNAVYQSPDSDQPRLVYADWLLERESPRAPFILEQLEPQKRVTKADQRREKVLVQQHLHRWLGPIEPVVERSKARFERGFLAITATRFVTAKQYADLGNHPAWSTVRGLLTVDDEHLQRCAFSSLQYIEPALDWAQLATLARRGTPYPRLRAIEVSERNNTAVERRLVSQGVSLPAFRSLYLTAPKLDDDLRWLAGTPLGARLTYLYVTDERALVPAWNLAMAQPNLSTFVVGRSPRYRFTKTDGGWTVEVSSLKNAENTAAELRRLPAPLKVTISAANNRATREKRLAGLLRDYPVTLKKTG
ncbi:MAG: TIGR02996 domain-containing protein [Archangium sp.]|nr:TIGR02996 domain-containing protein [Archangium sp.]